MKKAISIVLLILSAAGMYAQQGINYKAQLKDGSGNVLANTFMNVQFTIHEITSNGTIVYQESHNGITTDANGLLILAIGTIISPSIGVFSAIDWAAELHFLQTTITYTGGTINFDATEFMAVPYALHSKTAENVFSGDYNDLTNQPTIPTYNVNTFYAELGGYVIEVSDGGKHGLVVAMQDQGISSWYLANNLLSNSTNHDTNGAKFKDWRLPTTREIYLMCQVYNNGNILNLSLVFYWSSQEEGPDDASVFRMLDCNFYSGSKTGGGTNVRAFRAF